MRPVQKHKQNSQIVEIKEGSHSFPAPRAVLTCRHQRKQVVDRHSSMQRVLLGCWTRSLLHVVEMRRMREPMGAQQATVLGKVHVRRRETWAWRIPASYMDSSDSMGHVQRWRRRPDRYDWFVSFVFGGRFGI